MCSEFDTPTQRFVVFARDGHSNRFTDTDTLKLTAKAPEDDLDISEGGLWLKFDTLPETNIFAPENGWLEDEFPFGFRPIFRCENDENVSFREGKQSTRRGDVLDMDHLGLCRSETRISVGVQSCLTCCFFCCPKTLRIEAHNGWLEN